MEVTELDIIVFFLIMFIVSIVLTVTNSSSYDDYPF